MVKELLLSFKDNLKSKTTNPFYGTLIIVWIIHNWELIYTFFYFEPSLTFDDRVSFLQEYLNPSPFLNNLINCIFISFAVLVVSFFLLNLSRLITNFYEKRITPWIYKITDSNSVVLKSDFELLKKDRDNISDKLNLEREQKLKYQGEIEILEKVIAAEKLQLRPDFRKDIDNDKVVNIISLLKTKNLLPFFENFQDVINNRTFISDSNIESMAKDKINNLMKFELISVSEVNNREKTKRFELTDLGKKVKQQIIDKQIDNQ